MHGFPELAGGRRRSLDTNLRHVADTKVAKTLVDEFPCRPHWTKNTREVLKNAVKNLDPAHIARFRAVRERFDPKGIFKSVVGEIIGVS